MRSLDTEDTIAAIASPAGNAIRGLIRISGPDSMAICRKLCRQPEQFDRALSGSSRSFLFDHDFNVGHGFLSGTALVWPDRRSYTRQPTVEIHILGSQPLLDRLLGQICQHGARLAEPGEFTLRAFLSGRLDLTQAEAVLAVIDAENETQFETALQQLAGGLSGPLSDLRQQLLSVLAELEAGLDFVEEDIEFISQTQLESQLLQCQSMLDSVVQQISSRNLESSVVSVALIGLPNSGKSSLLNALSESDHAIVTDIAGTTTDFVAVEVRLEGASGTSSQVFKLIDTAGFEDADSEIMRAAQGLQLQQSQQSQIRLLCHDVQLAWTEWEIGQIQRLQPHDVLVLTKSDLLPKEDARHRLALEMLPKQISETGLATVAVLTSSESGQGLDQLKQRLMESVELGRIGEASVVGSTIRRAAESLRQSQQALDSALIATKQQLGEEIVAAEIREALAGLANVVGEVYTDDILDVVFGRFCIGK